VLELCAASVAAVQGKGEGDGSQLNIAYVAYIRPGVIPATLSAFRKLYPLVPLNLFVMSGAEQFHALGSGRIDLGYVGFSPLNPQDGLLSACVSRDAVLLALPKRHPLAKCARVKLASLASDSFVGLSPRAHPGAREWVLNICQSAGFAGKIIQEADGLPMAMRFVADGLGLTFLPEQVTGSPHDGIVFRPLSPPLRLPSRIAWRAGNPSKPLQDYIQITKDLSGNV
jgi:DNA-binding transcriptional LysR family regulator